MSKTIEVESIKHWTFYQTKFEQGDTLVVDNLEEGIFTLHELLKTLSDIHDKGVKVESKKQEWFTYEVQSGLLQMETDFHSKRIKQAINNTMKPLGRPPRPNKAVEKAIEIYLTQQFTAQQVADMCGISKSTLYRNLKKKGLT